MPAPTDDFSALEALDRLTRARQTGYLHGLTPSERLVMLALVAYANGRGECWPSLTTLSEGTCLGRSTVVRILDQLEAGGLIRRARQQRPRSTHYTLTLPPPGSPTAGLVPQRDYRSDGTKVVPQWNEVVPQRDQGSPTVGPEVPIEGPKEVAYSDSNTIGLSDRFAIAPSEVFHRAIKGGDPHTLNKLVDDQLYGFGLKTAEYVLSWPDRLLDELYKAGHEAAADAVSGIECQVVGNALRELIVKSKTYRWSQKAFLSYLVSACRVKEFPE